MDKLTLLLATKGRDEFTIRFLAYANQISLKYPIYIADGEPKNHIKKIIKNKNFFPNISISYHDFNDTSYLDYYNKIRVSLKSISTKYVMFIDNDDFIIPNGIEKCLDFLNQNDDYIGCSGRIGWFYTKKHMLDGNYISGKINYFFDKKGGYNPISYRSNLNSRMEQVSKKNTVTFYSVFDREKLYIASKEICDMNFIFTSNFEVYFHIRMISLGKIHAFKNTCSYLRQLGTSLGNDQNEQLFGRKYNLVNDFLEGRVSNDLNKILNFLESKLEFNESKIFIKTFLYEIWTNKLKLFIESNKMLNNNYRIFVRSIINKYMPKTMNYIWTFRHFKKVINSYKLDDHNDFDNLKLFMRNFSLNKYLNSKN